MDITIIVNGRCIEITDNKFLLLKNKKLLMNYQKRRIEQLER